MRNLLLLALATLALAPVLQAAPANDAPTLTPAHPSAVWQGAYFDVGATPDPALCSELTCDAFDFRVDLSPGLHPLRPGLEVSIRWLSEQNDFELYLYDASGGLVASSTGMVSTAEGLLVPHIPNGRYRAIVATGGVTASAYEGLAEIEWPSDLEGELMPDLVTMPPTSLRVVAPVYKTATPIEVVGLHPLSCGPDETAEAGALRCLRFNNEIANLGDGPLEARFNADGVPAGLVDEGERRIVQRIYDADGSWRERDAGRYTFHAVHAHFHYEDFAEHTLYRVTPGGMVVASEGRKAGFCMVDVALAAWNEPGNGARTYKAPVCLAPTENDESGAWLVQGITQGWADVYTWDLPDQYVDITGLEDGCYRLATVADPLGYFQEKDISNNGAHVDFTLRGDAVEEGC